MNLLHISFNSFIINESSIIDDISFEEDTYEDNIEILAKHDNLVIGSISIEEKIDAFWYFQDYFTEDKYNEMFPNDEMFAIQSISVAKSFMNKGIAKELMKLAINKAKELKYSNVYLNASPMGFSGLKLPDLVKFYEKFGFKAILKQNRNVQMLLTL
jgi:predicted N-acetyltransferase YhbS